MLLSASPRRAALESCLGIAVLLPLSLTVGPTGDGQLVWLSQLLMGELIALFLALRLRLPQGNRWRQFGAEVIVASRLAVTLAALYTLLALTRWRGDEASAPFLPILLAVAGMHGLTYLLLRGIWRTLRWWNRLRQQRLLWSLTHDQLLVVLALVLFLGSAVAISFLGAAFITGPTRNPLSVLTQVAQTLRLSVTGPLYLGFTALLLIGALPLAILLSYLFSRRIVQRVEGLAQATDALRQGHYATRVPIDGQDELARLQANFNAMAAELDRTLRDLQTERDRTAGLLQTQRELVASVSHELRTPLTIQRAYLDTILATIATQKGPLPASLAADLAVVEQETERLQTLLEDLFTLARAEVGRLVFTAQPLDLSLVAAGVVDTLAPLAWQSGRIELAFQPTQMAEPTLALADAGRVEQILRNLIHNALRHTPPGGLVLVALSAEATTVCVEVRDTGSGIAEIDLPQIWNRFYRAESARASDQRGVGLGLALVKELTEAMGGKVAVTSKVGMGSTFTIYLPRSTPVDIHSSPLHT